MVWRKKLKAKSRTPVQWIDNSGGKPAPFVRDLPPNREFIEPTEQVAEQLTIGNVFVALVNMGLRQTRDSTPTAGLLPTLVPYGHVKLVEPGTVMLYAGTIRLEERQHSGRIVTVVRHTFIVTGGRYIVADLTQLRPA